MFYNIKSLPLKVREQDFNCENSGGSASIYSWCINIGEKTK